MTTASANADAPARQRPVLSRDAALHNIAVRNYFVQAGLPEAQIASVTEQAVMENGGREGEPTNPSMAIFDYWFSTVNRQSPSGVPIVDSFAWARLNADGDSVFEAVYWPSLSSTVLAEADALQKLISDPNSKPAYLAKLAADTNADLEHGRVVIRHTPGVWSGAFAERASFDVPTANKVVHFDISGARFELPSEVEGSVGTVNSSSK